MNKSLSVLNGGGRGGGEKCAARRCVHLRVDGRGRVFSYSGRAVIPERTLTKLLSSPNGFVMQSAPAAAAAAATFNTSGARPCLSIGPASNKRTKNCLSFFQRITRNDFNRSPPSKMEEEKDADENGTRCLDRPNFCFYFYGVTMRTCTAGAQQKEEENLFRPEEGCAGERGLFTLIGPPHSSQFAVHRL